MITERRLWGAHGALALLGLLVAGALAPVVNLAFESSGDASFMALLGDPVLGRALRFTLWQAFASTVLSVGLAVPVAIALHRDRTLPGRVLLLRLFALPLALPQLVAVLGLLGLYGQNGVVAALTEMAGAEFPSIYGLWGILIAHAFFNLPLSVRLMLGALDTMPVQYERLAAQLGMGGWARFRHVFWPVMRSSAMGAAGLVFMLCATSFTIVLVLGGGPRSTTLEVAIYQALTFDFDIARALMLTVLQIAVALCALTVLNRFGGGVPSGLSEPGGNKGAIGRVSLAQRCLSIALVVPLGLFVAAPFVMIILKGLGADIVALLGQTSTIRAITTSAVLGGFSALIASLAALGLALGVSHYGDLRRHSGPATARERVLTHAPSLVLVLSPLVLAAGWFVLLRQFTNVYAMAPYVVIAINAAMALPFAMRVVLPSVLAAQQRHDRLCRQLGLSGWQRWKLVDWPVLRQPLLVAFAFAMALSLGDFGVIALFGSQDVQTLPFLIYQQMGSYRSNHAEGLALILCVLTMVLMIWADHGSSTSTNGSRK